MLQYNNSNYFNAYNIIIHLNSAVFREQKICMT